MVLNTILVCLYGSVLGDSSSSARFTTSSYASSCASSSGRLFPPPRSQWAAVIKCLRRYGSEQMGLAEAVSALWQDGFNHEALWLEGFLLYGAPHSFSDGERSQERAMSLIESGRVLTALCDNYPHALKNRMGPSAPPILWLSHPELAFNPPWSPCAPQDVPASQDAKKNVGTGVGVVGCRQPQDYSLELAQEVADWTVEREYLPITGGAIGCDSAFAKQCWVQGTRPLVILPCGLPVHQEDFLQNDIHPGGFQSNDFPYWAISVCPPGEPFSTQRAMERNRLIYTFSEMSVVCSARYRQGGSWHGAVSAIRDRQPVIVPDVSVPEKLITDWEYQDLGNALGSPMSKTHPEEFVRAIKAMLNLGAIPLTEAESNMLTSSSNTISRHASLDACWAIAQRLRKGEICTGLFSEVLSPVRAIPPHSLPSHSMPHHAMPTRQIGNRVA